MALYRDIGSICKYSEELVNSWAQHTLTKLDTNTEYGGNFIWKGIEDEIQWFIRELYERHSRIDLHTCILYELVENTRQCVYNPSIDGFVELDPYWRVTITFMK
jgi:hypothetical protein